MKKFCALHLILLAIFACLSSSASAKVIAHSGAGILEDVDGVRVVRLYGSPREIGIQHGRLLKAEITGLTNYFFEEKKNIFGTSIPDVEKGAAVLQKFIPEDILLEMQGIADGSGVPFGRILIMNTFLDVVSNAWVGVKPLCSNFAVFGKASADGNIVHGRNLDWSANNTLMRMNTVFFITPKKGVPFVSLSWPGIAGTLTGMNTAGISMGEMTSMSSEATLSGTPIMVLLRELLQSSASLSDAYRILSDSHRTTGYNVLVTSGRENTGFLVEMTSKHIIRIDPTDDVLIHTNHFINKDMVKTQMKYLYLFDSGKKSDTFYRYDRFVNLIQADRGAIDAKKAVSYLSDKFDPIAKSVSGSLDNTICQSNTLQSVVMRPKSGDFLVSLTSLPACGGKYVSFKLGITKGNRK